MISPFLFARKLYLPYSFEWSVSSSHPSDREMPWVIRTAHVRLLSRLWFPSQKAQQSRRRMKARPSLVSIGSICIGSRTCLRTPVSTPPQPSVQVFPSILSFRSIFDVLFSRIMAGSAASSAEGGKEVSLFCVQFGGEGGSRD